MTFLEENNIVLSRTQRMKDFVKSWALPVICFVVFWLIFKFVLMTSIIPTQSMYPTLSAPCFTVGVRTDVLNKPYERGDIVLFQRDDGNERFYAKRIVGMPGDVLEIKHGQTYINGVEYEESYLNETPEDLDFGPFQVPEDHYFKNNMLISQKVSQQTLNLINLYNFMLPVYASVYNLANAYADEIRRAVSRELFGQDEGASDEMFVKQIDALNKKLVDAEACVERAENKAADADKLLQQSKKRENALTSKLETAYAEIDELMQLVPEETEDDLPDEQEALEEETLQPDDEPDVDYGKKLDELLQKYSVAVVGGNQNLMKRFQVLHPDAIYVSKDMVAACDQMIHAADLVLCKVDSMSHALYNKCKVTCHRYDVQMNYLPNVTSCTRLEKCMCEMIEALST